MRNVNEEMRGGYVVNDSFLYWSKRVDGFSMLVDRVRKVANTLIDVVAVIIFLAGGLSLFVRVVNVPTEILLTMSFWQTPDERLLQFFVGLLAISFFYYRRVLTHAEKQRVRFKEYNEDAHEDEAVVLTMVAQAPEGMKRKNYIAIQKAYTKEALKVVDGAYRLAKKLGHAEVQPLHLYGSILASSDGALVFGRLGLLLETYKEQYGRLLAAHEGGAKDAVLSTEVHEVLTRAYLQAQDHNQAHVGVIELLAPSINADSGLQDLLYGHNIDAQKVTNVVQWVRVHRQLVHRSKNFSSAARLKPKGSMNRAMTSVATPFLDQMTDDLTRKAANLQLPLIVGRRKKFREVFRSIEGGNRSIVLVGKSGVGKGAIIEGIAQKMVEESVPEVLQDKRLLKLDIARLVSGATPSEAQERLLIALGEVARAGNIVLVVPNVAGMVGISSGSGESIDLSQVFATELARGYFFAIATATPEEYGHGIEGKSLDDALNKVDIEEPDVNDAIHILESKAGSIEYRNNVYFTYEAIEAAVTLTDRYMHGYQLPEKAIDMAQEAALAVKNSRGAQSTVTKEDIGAVVSDKTNVPLKQLTEEESQKLLHLEYDMHGRVIGQEEAVSSVAAAIRRAGVELRSGKRPIANFLFLGPTGVGKTELAKTLAETYLGNEDTMIRLDMSEYQDKAALYKLIGEPASDISGGILSEAVRKNPFSLVLLDEIEKAHPDILTVFLQVMDDGRLTDNTGRTIDFTNVILIATSNAGAGVIQDEIKAGSTATMLKEKLMNEELKKHFRPEFINRFDDVIVFTPLTEDETQKIARLMLRRVEVNLEEKGITFEITDEALAELAKEGYDPLYGARPLRRVIQDKVDNAIAEAILKGEVGRRDTLIYEVGGVIRVDEAEEL